MWGPQTSGNQSISKKLLKKLPGFPHSMWVCIVPLEPSINITAFEKGDENSYEPSTEEFRISGQLYYPASKIPCALSRLAVIQYFPFIRTDYIIKVKSALLRQRGVTQDFELFRTVFSVFLFAHFFRHFFPFFFNDFEFIQCEEPTAEFSTFYLLSFVCFS